MDSLHRILARDGAASSGPSDTVIDIMIALLALVFVGLVLVAVLVLLKRVRRRQQMRAELLPTYHDDAKRTGNHRQLTISTSARGGARGGRTSVIVFGKDGQPMLANPSSPPHSPDNVPEIHITFPDEHDDQGRRKSGRVVVVRVGENATVGMEPLSEDELPAYEKDGKSQFYAIDIEKIGGLKEKERYGL